MSAVAGVHLAWGGVESVTLLLAIAACVSLFGLTSVRVWTARRAWRRAKNLLVGR